MIKVIIEVKNNKIVYRFQDENVTLTEAGLLNLKLDEAKDFIKSFEFPSEFEIKEGYEEEEE